MSGSSLFYWFGPDTEKPRRPNLSVLARGTTRSPWSVVRSRGRCACALTELQISCNDTCYHIPVWNVIKMCCFCH